MSFGPQNPWSARPAYDSAVIDQGLRQHMLQVYNYMAAGLGVTGAVAWLTYHSGFVQTIYRTPLLFVVMLAPLVVVFVLSAQINRMSVAAASLTFYVYSALMGLSLSSIFLVYSGASIAETFFITAGTFLGMSLYGYTTRADLTRFGSFLVMGLWGIIIASVIGLFFQSSALQFAISVAGVIVFTGLTAWDTQRIKESYVEGYGEAMQRVAIMGALQLYLDFVNLFLMLLRLFGDRRN